MTKFLFDEERRDYCEEIWFRNVGKLGECIYLRFTPDYVKELTGKDADIKFYTAKDFDDKFGGTPSVPIEVAEDVEGNYEAVCEYGIEIR